MPSGLKIGDSSALGDVVNARGVAPARGSTTKMSVFSLLSGSSVRLAENAMSDPSGDHTGVPSSCFGSVETWMSAFVAISKTWRWRRMSFRKPVPSCRNCRRSMTIGFGFSFSFSASDLSPVSAGSFGSGSETMSARRLLSGDQANDETPGL